jgi:protein ImuA
MIAHLRQSLQALQKPAGLDGEPGSVALGVEAIDAALGGGLARGALHEISAAGEANAGTAAGFALAVSSRAARKAAVWIAEDMALAESGAPYGPGLDSFGLAPERLLSVAAAQPRDLLWAMEEALRCRSAGAVIGELRHGEIDSVAVRRLSLAAAASGALALLLRASPPHDASTAATRWVVSAASSVIPGRELEARLRASSTRYGERTRNPETDSEIASGFRVRGLMPASRNDEEIKTCFTARLTRNRRGPRGAWTLQWSDDDGFVLATHAQPVAAPAADRPHRQIARHVA